MESIIDTLVKDTKELNTVSSYLKLYNYYKSAQKYFSAQQTLERCIKNVQLESSDQVIDSFSENLSKIINSHPDIKHYTIIYNTEIYFVYGLLGDVCLTLKEPIDAMVWLLAAYQNYANSSILHQKFQANVVFCGLLQCFLSITLHFLYKKLYKEAMCWKEHTNWLIESIKSSQAYSFSSEKLELMIGNYYFILYSWYGNISDFEACEHHTKNIANTEIQFILAYYRNKNEARRYARELVMKQPGISIFWMWLSFVEEDYSRKFNAISKL